MQGTANPRTSVRFRPGPPFRPSIMSYVAVSVGSRPRREGPSVHLALRCGRHLPFRGPTPRTRNGPSRSWPVKRSSPALVTTGCVQRTARAQPGEGSAAPRWSLDRRGFSDVHAIFTAMTSKQLSIPLTKDELQSLAWIAMMATRVAIPAAHIERLLAAGYIEESASGPVLTDLGVLKLEQVEGRASG
jgi:hypothetical protein